MTKIYQLLTNGLLSGYAGSGKISKIKRGVFDGVSSDFKNDEGSYHDEWFVPTHMGGGQELVKVGDQMFTRLYGGGSPDKKLLDNLGITGDHIGNYLKEKLLQLKEKTRLFDDCEIAEGDWTYRYRIILKDEHIKCIVAEESIYYKEIRVHLHPFILSEVK